MKFACVCLCVCVWVCVCVSVCVCTFMAVYFKSLKSPIHACMYAVSSVWVNEFLNDCMCVNGVCVCVCNVCFIVYLNGPHLHISAWIDIVRTRGQYFSRQSNIANMCAGCPKKNALLVFLNLKISTKRASKEVRECNF